MSYQIAFKGHKLVQDLVVGFFQFLFLFVFRIGVPKRVVYLATTLMHIISNPPGEGGDIGIPGPGTFIGMTIVAFGFENGFYLFRDLCVCDRRRIGPVYRNQLDSKEYDDNNERCYFEKFFHKQGKQRLVSFFLKSGVIVYY